MKWRTLRAAVAHRLRDAGIESPDTEARFITEECSGHAGGEWLEIEDTDAIARAEARVHAMCERRAAGEPLQYVLGSWAFRDLDLMVDSRVLIPRPETEIVVEVALDEAVRLGLRRAKARGAVPSAPTAVVADLGTGSGAIALALEHELPEVEVWATDASEDALAVARANLAGCGATRVRVAPGSWFDALPRELRGWLTLVVSNPPYVAQHEVIALPPVVLDYEPRTALVAGPTGLEALTHLVDEAPAWLAPRGALVAELAPHQAADMVPYARAAGFDDVTIRPDLTGRDRVLVARRG
ncbi:MAG TPA: peptide chain release factor N(5)-glutamine methyltransferase [Acidimicrobiia bacterium]|nr:peptide chain release factor N(5)-glutamine methyltransferase [Acidimicrobiia bacterium]